MPLSMLLFKRPTASTRCRTAYEHADAETSHIVRFAERMQFNGDLFCAWNLQDALRTKIVKIDLGIGHIVDNDQVMTLGKLNGLFKEATVAQAARRVIGIVEPEQAHFCQRILWNVSRSGR